MPPSASESASSGWHTCDVTVNTFLVWESSPSIKAQASKSKMGEAGVFSKRSVSDLVAILLTYQFILPIL